MNYYISDLHLFQETSIRFDERPFKNLEEMHEIIKEKWNCKVNNGDKVFILGDISCRGKNENLISYISTLKGQKILIKETMMMYQIIDIISYLQTCVIIRKSMIL